VTGRERKRERGGGGGCRELSSLITRLLVDNNDMNTYSQAF